MTTGIGNQWDPGDPPEVHSERSTIMATRGIALGRIINWFKNCDPEEGKFAIHRAGNILQERMAKVENADSLGKVKRTRRTKKDITKSVLAGEESGVPGATERAIGA
jgi:hypothetical protein